MASDLVFKDLGDIYCRLLDHHPVIKGEIGIFVNEFEEKRKDRECVRLQRALEYCREIQEKQITEADQLAKQHLPSIVKSASDAVQNCEEVMRKEGSVITSQHDWLEEQRRHRAKEWLQFMDEMLEKTKEVDKEKEVNIQKVKDNYTELEHKLKIKS